MPDAGSELPVLLFLAPFLGGLLCAAVGWAWRPLAPAIAVVAMSATAVLSVWANIAVYRAGELRAALGGWAPHRGIELVVDPLSAFVAAVIGVVGLAVVVGSVSPVRSELRRRGAYYYSLALLLIGGLVGMTVTHDLFNLFVHLEVASLSAYALTAAGGRGASRAALRYLLVGSMGASLYLLSVGFLYAATGMLNMSEVAAALPEANPRLVLIAAVLAVVGLAIKMGLFPLHAWMPGAYSRAPLGGAALMAPLVTKVSAYAMVRLLFDVYQVHRLDGPAFLLELLCWAGAAAVIAGAVLALFQNDLLRLLAYSSISQMGIVALGIGLANASSLTGGVLHIANDALMKGALFIVAAGLVMKHGIREVGDLPRLKGRAPWTSGAVLVTGLSLVGLPPMCGFFGKWYVLKGAVEDERWVLAGAVIVGSLATVAYVARLVDRMFFARDHVEPAEVRAPARSTLLVGALMAGGVIVFGLFAERVVTLIVTPALPPGL